MNAKPTKIFVWNNRLYERKDLNEEGWTWEPMESGGLLKIRHDSGNAIKVFIE
jgi:hypothetical protein